MNRHRAFTRPVPPDAGARRGRPWGELLLGGVLFAGAFAIGLWLAFPVEWCRQAIARELGKYRIELVAEDLTLAPTAALHGRRAVLRFLDPGLPALPVERFTLRPAWGSFLTGDPGVHLAAELLQGDVSATLTRGGDVRARAGQLVFKLPLQGGQAVLEGVLDEGELRRMARGKGPVESSLTLSLSRCSLSSPLLGVLTSRPLALGKVTLAASGRGPLVTVTRLEAGDGDLQLSGTGTLQLGDTAAASRLALDLQVRPTATAPRELANALGMLGAHSAGGGYSIRVGGTLAQPRLGLAGSGGQGTDGTE